MLVLVRYGDNRELLVNSWCKISAFFDYVRKVSELELDTELDLCDSKGEIMRMAEQTDLFANQFLKEKEKYILLKVERKIFEFMVKNFFQDFDILNLKTGKSYDMKPVYTPLLSNDILLNDNFLSKLNPVKNKPNSSRGPKSKNKNIPPKTSRNKNSNAATNTTTAASIASSEADVLTRSGSKIESKSSKEIDFSP
jgi:hypothetical protein